MTTCKALSYETTESIRTRRGPGAYSRNRRDLGVEARPAAEARAEFSPEWMMNRTCLATLLRALRRFGRWLQINLTYVFLLPPERQDLLDLVAHYWIQAIRLTIGAALRGKAAHNRRKLHRLTVGVLRPYPQLAFALLPGVLQQAV